MVHGDVHGAYRLWYSAVGAAVLSSALSIPIINDLARLRGQVLPADVEPAQAGADFAIGAGIGTVITAAVGGALLLVAMRMRAGHGWARTLLTGAGVVGILVGLLTIEETFALFGLGVLGAIVALLRLAMLLLVAAAVVRMRQSGAANRLGMRAW